MNDMVAQRLAEMLPGLQQQQSAGVASASWKPAEVPAAASEAAGPAATRAAAEARERAGGGSKKFETSKKEFQGRFVESFCHDW